VSILLTFLFRAAQQPGNDSASIDQLRVLKQQEESLAETLRAEHDMSIAAAEQHERDLRRQLQEVEEGKAEVQDASETDGDSVRGC